MGGLLAFTSALVPGLGGEFMPQLEEGNLWIRAAAAPDGLARRRRRGWPRGSATVIASVPEVRGVMSHVGRPDDGTDVTSFFNLEFNVPLKPMEQWRRKPVDALRPQALGPRDHPRGDPGRADGEVQGISRRSTSTSRS